MDASTSSSVSSLSLASFGPAMVEISKETIHLYDKVDQVGIKQNTDHNLDGSFSIIQEGSNTSVIEEGLSSTPSSNLKLEIMIRGRGLQHVVLGARVFHFILTVQGK